MGTLVHATGHTSGDGISNAIYLNAKKGDRKDAVLGHPQLLVMFAFGHVGPGHVGPGLVWFGLVGV